MSIKKSMKRRFSSLFIRRRPSWSTSRLFPVISVVESRRDSVFFACCARALGPPIAALCGLVVVGAPSAFDAPLALGAFSALCALFSVVVVDEVAVVVRATGAVVFMGRVFAAISL